MAHIFRAYKSEVPILLRVCCNCHNHQRREYTYYEVLRIAPNATQKEIKDAYIKLSKEMHPDCGVKGNHADFVKINEAYNVLSKKKHKQHYDMKLKYDTVYTTGTHQHHGFNNTYRQWEEYNAQYSRNKMKYSKENRRNAFGYCVLLIFIGTVIQIFHIQKLTDFNRRVAFEKSKRLQVEYQRAQKENENKTMEEKLLRIMELSEKYSVPSTDK